jgi:dihydroorotate dehydrogenase electron transfer subunit
LNFAEAGPANHRYNEMAGFGNILQMYDEITAVTENVLLSGGNYLLSVESPRQAQAARPGQFAMLRILGRSDVLLRRPLSIYDLKTGNSDAGNSRKQGSLKVLQFLYKVVGHGTRLMSELRPGDRIGILAPLGHGFFEEEYLPRAHEADEILHVAGGIGIAALLLAAKRLAEAGFHQRLFFGGRTKDDLVGVEDFKPNVDAILLATENGSAGYRGFVTRPLEDYLSHHTNKKYLLMMCGPWAMLRASVALAKKYGHPCMVSMENRMGCGLGVCLGCCIHVQGSGHEAYQRVCTEGPVFWADKVIWEDEKIAKT